jgi:AcrR family transcriptional regulator
MNAATPAGRSYTMTARARSVERTRESILDATVALHLERLAADIALDDIAGRAGVSVQTVLRHFGSRDGLVEAALTHAEGQVRAERRAPAGDLPGALRVLLDHYEARGDGVLLLLAQERSQELARRITGEGRRLHRDWVEETFAPHVAAADDGDELVDLLVVATDVYAWKLLRRDRGLSRAQTESRLHTLVSRVLATDTRGAPWPTSSS